MITNIYQMFMIANPADHHLARIRKMNKDLTRKHDFKDIKFPVKIRDTNKIKKKNCINIHVFGYENKEKFSIYFC